MLQKMLEDYHGNVPRSAILQMYHEIGMNAEEGDRQVNKLLEEMKGKKVSGERKRALLSSPCSLLIRAC